MQIATNKILALDVGTVRIGVSTNPGGISIAQPHSTLNNSPDIFEEISELVKKEEIQAIVVGLPRGLQGQDTDQTTFAREFGKKLGEHCGLPISFQDEALTSVQSEKQLKQAKRGYTKADIDAEAATIILQDYLDGLGVANG